MRRILTVLLVVATLFLPAHESKADTWRHRRCRYQSLERGQWTDREVRKSIRCAVDHWRVPGGRAKALAVARCESGLEADAVGSGSYGVYQFVASTWESVTDRWRRFRRRWDVSDRVFSGRANVLMAIRLAHTHAGWDPWSCG